MGFIDQGSTLLCFHDWCRAVPTIASDISAFLQLIPSHTSIPYSCVGVRYTCFQCTITGIAGLVSLTSVGAMIWACSAPASHIRDNQNSCH